MAEEASRNQFARRLTRRGFIGGSVGAAAGAGAALSTGLWTPVLADGDDDKRSSGIPLPIPHRTFLPFGPTSVGTAGVHFYFPGTVDGKPSATDPFGPHAEGRDPSTVTHFDGFIGQVDLSFSGTGRDTKTGAKASYDFHTDTRFMTGDFIGSDEKRHHGTLAFI